MFMNFRLADTSRAQLTAACGAMGLLLASASFAAPSVSGISGTVANGSSITISGSGFGTGDTTPLLWDDFESSSASTGSRMAGSPRMGSWVPAGNGVYSSAAKNSGGRSLMSAFSPDAQWQNFTVTMPNGQRFFQSFWFRYDTSGTGGQVKLALVHGNSGQGEFAPTVNNNSSTTSWWMSNIATESSAGNAAASWGSNPGPNAWHHFEMAMQQSSGGGAGDGSITTWIDGKQMYSAKNVATRDSSQYYWNEMGFLHGVTNMGVNTTTYLDDVYANNSWARVVLCDSATYSGCKRTEIQPVETWADGSIKVTLATSGFTDPSNVYIYVFDANGTGNTTGLRLCATCTSKVPSAPTVTGVG